MNNFQTPQRAKSWQSFLTCSCTGLLWNIYEQPGCLANRVDFLAFPSRGFDKQEKAQARDYRSITIKNLAH